MKYAKAVCDQVDVPLEVVHLTDEYWKNVVSYIIEEYRCGRTPNPDVLCNTRIKFGAFMDAISSKEFDYVASGHYANVVHSFTDQMDKPPVLELSKDMVPMSRTRPTSFHISLRSSLNDLFSLLDVSQRMKSAVLLQNWICLTEIERIHKEFVSLGR